MLSSAPQSPLECDGRPVLFDGPCQVDGPVSDAKFGLHTTCHPIMYREVEVFQWTQTSQNIEERRGDQVRRSVKYSYKAQWSSTF